MLTFSPNNQYLNVNTTLLYPATHNISNLPQTASIDVPHCGTFLAKKVINFPPNNFFPIWNKIFMQLIFNIRKNIS